MTSLKIKSDRVRYNFKERTATLYRALSYTAAMVGPVLGSPNRSRKVTALLVVLRVVV
jgi:hypothetical protein